VTSKKTVLVALACAWLSLGTGCAEQVDENGVDYDRAGDTGYARVTFSLVRPNASSELLPTVHHLYLDESGTIPGAGGHDAEVGAGINTAFDSPNRGADGSFVRIEVVDFRRSLCGRGTVL
jgi:hypothetical protein